MADVPNTPSLPKIHQPMSRRAVLSTGIVATALAAVPVLATQPIPPRDRLTALIAELKAVAQELNPAIEEWKVVVLDRQVDAFSSRAAVLICAFEYMEKDRFGPLLADDATGTTDFADWEKRRLRNRKAVQS